MRGLKELAQACGFAPASVVDVGVRRGTPELYNCFQGATFYLVDPQRGAEKLLEQKPHKSKFINVALGSAPGSIEISDQGGKSTALHRTILSGGDSRKRYTVPVQRFDDLCRDLDIKPPIGVKIDTEGYEMEVLKGIGGKFDSIEFFIIECSILERFKERYFFSDIVGILAMNGFEFLCSLSGGSRVSKYIDALFVRKDNPSLPIDSRSAENRLRSDLLNNPECAETVIT